MPRTDGADGMNGMNGAGGMNGAAAGREAADAPLGLVVARYAEDVSWLAALDLPGVVYNKGAALTPSPPVATMFGVSSMK